MKIMHQKLTTWGHTLHKTAKVWQPTNREDARKAILQCNLCTPRGNGRCYGDAALGDEVIDLKAYNLILHFQEETGLITCQSGVLLKDLIARIVPEGWFLHVTPGIQSITVGGAIASDVHGKNHTTSGCFGRWVEEFTLLQKDGRIITCSRTEHPELFYLTCGAMGQTGIILEATLRLRRISSCLMREEVTHGHGIAPLLRSITNTRQEYRAAWLNLLEPTQSDTVPWVLFAADHDSSEQPRHLRYSPIKALSVPFTLPFCVLQPWLMRIYNRLQWRAALQKSGKCRTTDLQSYFYPLDRIGHWNRLYGPKGFYQYQFCVPTQHAEQCIQEVVQHILRSKHKPYLAVLKQHGPQEKSFVNSFPIQGYSLALDFPASAETVRMIRDLDQLIYPYGGKVYLAKDAVSHGRMSRIDLQALHPHRQGMSSVLAERIQRDLI